MATIIGVDGTESAFVMPSGAREAQRLELLQSAVGGYIELIRVPDGRVMFVNEEGKRMRLAANEAASLVAGGTVLGAVVLCTQAELEQWDAADAK